MVFLYYAVLPYCKINKLKINVNTAVRNTRSNPIGWANEVRLKNLYRGCRKPRVSKSRGQSLDRHIRSASRRVAVDFRAINADALGLDATWSNFDDNPAILTPRNRPTFNGTWRETFAPMTHHDDPRKCRSAAPDQARSAAQSQLGPQAG